MGIGCVFFAVAVTVGLASGTDVRAMCMGLVFVFVEIVAAFGATLEMDACVSVPATAENNRSRDEKMGLMQVLKNRRIVLSANQGLR